MKRLAIACGVLATLVAFGWGETDSGTTAGKAGKNRAAAKIVVDVLQREARESVADRAELLKPALEQVPHYEPAMWLSGFVFEPRQKEWLRYDEVPAEVKNDKSLSTYLATRSKYPDTMDGQIDLARWCLKRNLTDQARAHLTKVLEANQDHQEARRLLGQRQVAGNWLGEAEIAEAEEQVQKQLAAFRKWKPRLEKIRTNLERGKRQSDAARAELMAISDPEAAIAVEVVLCADDVDTTLVGIEALKNLPGRESAASLTRLAMFSSWDPVGQTAARALGSQDKYNYVPQLLSLMQSPVQSRAEIYGSFANGTLLYRHAFYREGQDKKELAVLDAPYRHVFTEQVNTISRPMPAGQDAEALKTPNNLVKRKIAMEQFQADAMQKAAVREAALARYNMTVDALNSRICSILSEAIAESPLNSQSMDAGDSTAMKAGRPTSPPQWSQWWYDYNEIYTPETPTRVVYVPGPGRMLMTPSGVTRRYSCLAGDTIVWTETGPVNIKDVSAGDRVLACDVETGCLALKPVLRKTIRPKENTGELVAITADGKTIFASGGHVFWVAGEGWIKARDLKPGIRLHTLKGTANVDTVGTSTAQETYNLIVADFHTFFAGDRISLTHDNTIRQPTNMVVPRLSRQEAKLTQTE